MKLFDTAQDPTQDLYRQCLELQWDKDCRKMMAIGIIPPWLESDNMLDRDEFRILSLIADDLFVYWGSRSDNRALADRLGFVSVFNLKAAVGKCLDRGLIMAFIRDDRGLLELKQYGRYLLDIVEMDEIYDNS